MFSDHYDKYYNNSDIYWNFQDDYDRYNDYDPVEGKYHMTSDKNKYNKASVAKMIDSKSLRYRNKDLYTFFAPVKRDIEDLYNFPEKITDASTLVYNKDLTPYDIRLAVDKSINTTKIADRYLIPTLQPYVDDWITQQAKYLDKLNDRQTTALKAYTYYGDVFMNGFLRGTLEEDTQGLIDSCLRNKSIPFKYAMYDMYDQLKYKYKLVMPRKDTLLMKDGKIDNRVISEIISNPTNYKWFCQKNNLIPLIIILLEDITKVFLNSPRPKKDITVYRGVNTEHVPLNFKSTEYLSTSLNPFSAFRFTSRLVDDIFFCLYEITIRAKVPCIYMQKFSDIDPPEYEVLIPPGVSFTMSQHIFIKTQVEPSIYTRITKEEYVQIAQSDEAKRKILVIAGTAHSFDIEATTLKSIVENWRREKERIRSLAERRAMKYGRAKYVDFTKPTHKIEEGVRAKTMTRKVKAAAKVNSRNRNTYSRSKAMKTKEKRTRLRDNSALEEVNEDFE